MSDQTRNLNPHKAAVAAIYLWSAEYSRQGGGSMDFWDQLGESHKDLCRRLVAAVSNALGERSHD